MAAPAVAAQFDDVVDNDGGGNNDRLSDLKAVDAGVDVDGVGAEDGQHAHVDVVSQAKVQVGTEQRPQRFWNDHLRQSKRSGKKRLIST